MPHDASGRRAEGATARSGGAAPGVVIITGGTSGIGRATAGLFAQRGWRVGLIARGEAGLRAALADVIEHGAQGAIAAADVADCGALEAAAAAIEAALGRCDVWVNCAGNGTFGRFIDTPADEYRRVTEVTYLGVVNGTRVALRRMLPRDGGCIVNVCSAVAFHGMPLLSSYSGAKHAVHGFGQSLCAELAQENSRVRVATVFPPAVNTPFFDHAPSHMPHPGRPMAPVYQPERVAEAILRAASGDGGDHPITMTAWLFSMGTRIAPALVRRAIHRLGYAGQLTADPSARARHAPTLFAPSERASPVRGAFEAAAWPARPPMFPPRWLVRGLVWVRRGDRSAARLAPVTVADAPVERTSGSA